MRILFGLVVFLAMGGVVEAQGWQYQTAESIIATTPRATYGGYYRPYRGTYYGGSTYYSSPYRSIPPLGVTQTYSWGNGNYTTFSY